MSISDSINIKSKDRNRKGKPLTESSVFDVRLAELIIKSTNLYFTIKLIPAIITPADEGRRFCRACGGDSLRRRERNIKIYDMRCFPMSRMIGTVARGVRAPIIRAGDDLAKIVPESVLAAAQEAGFQFHDRDVVAMTEAIVARAQGNYAKVGRHRRGRTCQAGRRDRGRHLPHPQPQPLRHLPAGHRRAGRRRSSSCSPTPPTRWATT